MRQVFIDPVSNRSCEVVLNPLGIRHPGCPELADVSIDLDAFYCTKCRMNGRVSGAWVHDLVTAETGDVSGR